MSKFIFWTLATLSIIILGPFYTFGFIIGQFIGACFYGYKEGRKAYLELMKWAREGAKK